MNKFAGQNKKYLYFFSIAVFLVILDQITKIYIIQNFKLHESLPVIQDFFHITYIRNPGAAFGIFRDANETFRSIFFLSLPPIVMGFIFMMIRGKTGDDRLQNLIFSLIFGGALGNYIDRVRFGYVIDFLDFHYKKVWSYPAFNVADMSIVIGIGILFYFTFQEEFKNTKKKRD